MAQVVGRFAEDLQSLPLRRERRRLVSILWLEVTPAQSGSCGNPFHAPHMASPYTESMAKPLSRSAGKGKPAKAPVCGWKHEKAARKQGALRIAGLDEVGRGP